MAEPATPSRPTVLSVDLDAVVANARALSRHAGRRPLLAVVKANAYGMGAVPVARALSEGAAAWLGVALVEEGIQLRKAGLGGPILLLGPAAPDQASAVVEHGITPALHSLQLLGALEAAAEAAGKTLAVHLKLDSGMGRLGFRPEELEDALAALGEASRLKVDGVFSNLASADDPASPQTARQLETFLAMVARIREAGHEPAWVDLANSSGLLAHPGTHLALCRPGLTLYGLRPSADLPDPGLREAVALTTVVAQVKHLPAGTPVGYSATYRTERPTTVGILPVGYADGLPRSLQGAGQVLVNGARCPIVGRVSMDLTAVDLTPAEPVREGATVTLWGRDGDESLSPWDWARWSGTIPYEVMTGVGCRVARRYLREGRAWTVLPILG